MLFFRFVTDEGVQEVGGAVNDLTTMSGPHIILFRIGESTQLCKFDNMHVPESPRRNLNIRQVGIVSPLALGYDFLGQIYQMRAYAGEHTEYTISQISASSWGLQEKFIVFSALPSDPFCTPLSVALNSG